MANNVEERPEGKPVSIALVCYSYPPVVGGSEIEAQRVCAALQKRGHRVEVLCSGGAPMPDLKHWIDPVGVPVRLFGGNLPEPLRAYTFAFGVPWTLLRHGRRYDVVYFLMGGLQIATALPVARWLGKNILMKFSGSSLIQRMTLSRLGRLELVFLRRWADRIMVLNDGMVQEASEAGLDLSKLMWMPNPVDTEEFRPAAPEVRAQLRAELKLPASVPFIVFVGRLAPEKELPSLLQAFARIAQDHPDVHLALVGDGPSRSALEEQARSLSISHRIHIPGMVRAADVRKWLQSSDIFVLVSSLEGLPCSLIEAMSVGLPSVVSDIPANTQLIESGTHGLIAPLKNDRAIANHLIELLRDSSMRSRMGTEARSRVTATYSIETVVKRYESLFREISPSSRA